MSSLRRSLTLPLPLSFETICGLWVCSGTTQVEEEGVSKNRAKRGLLSPRGVR